MKTIEEFGVKTFNLQMLAGMDFFLAGRERRTEAATVDGLGGDAAINPPFTAAGSPSL